MCHLNAESHSAYSSQFFFFSTSGPRKPAVFRGGGGGNQQSGDREGRKCRQETMKSLKFCSANEHHCSNHPKGNLLGENTCGAWRMFDGRFKSINTAVAQCFMLNPSVVTHILESLHMENRHKPNLF